MSETTIKASDNSLTSTLDFAARLMFRNAGIRFYKVINKRNYQN